MMDPRPSAWHVHLGWMAWSIGRVPLSFVLGAERAVKKTVAEQHNYTLVKCGEGWPSALAQDHHPEEGGK